MFRRSRDGGGEYPRLVSVETTSRCNATCPFCPYNVRVRDKTHMSDALFEKIIEECREFPLDAIEPFLNGEPFVDPKIMDRIEHIRSRLPRTKLRIYTNGYALSPKRVDELCGMGIDHLYVSLNTLDADKYEKIMGFKLKRTVDNIRYATDPSRRSRVARRITVRMTRMEDTTLAEQDQFQAFCKQHGVRCFIVGLFNYKGDIHSPFPVPSYACEHVTRLDILSNGNVTLCCQDQEGEYSLGNASDATLLEIYRGAAATRYRELHRSGRRMEAEPCGACNLFWTSTYGVPAHRALRLRLQQWWYVMRHRPVGKRAPAKRLQVCPDHAALLPDVESSRLRRGPDGQGSQAEDERAESS